MKKINVLISAAGSPLSQSIFKALKISSLNLNIYLLDISENAAGFHLNNKENNFVSPLVSKNDYKSFFINFIEKYNINVYFPIIENDYQFIEKNKKELTSLKIAGIKSNIYDLCNDKFKCFDKLSNFNIKIPLSFNVNKNTEFPNTSLILKPRKAASSKDIFLVKDKDRFNDLKRSYPNNYFLAQEYMNDPKEYTIGVYMSKDKRLKKTFIIERELKFGLSYKGTVIKSDSISDYAIKVCEILGTEFSANVQLKIHNGEPCLFEVNPRLSSTTCVRANFGFNEPELIIRELYGTLDEYKWNIESGSFMRYWEEIYVK